MGSNNTAAGAFAMLLNTDGDLNTASGTQSLFGNTTGSSNTGVGVDTLLSNDTGNGNAAFGAEALANAIGNGNIALGSNAGASLTSGNKNIYIGNKGKSVESQTIRLGQSQTQTFIAGIAGTPISGSTVLVNRKGQLGILASSARFKRDVHDMGTGSERLYDLRPVSFVYRGDASHERQYGLIAEGVAGIYPELVVRAEDGGVQSVKYEELIPMLLNELQHERTQLEVQSAGLARLRVENATLQSALAELRAREEERRTREAALALRLEHIEERAGLAAVARR